MRLKDESIRVMGDRLFFALDKIEEEPGYNLRNMESPRTQQWIRYLADCIHKNGTSAFDPITIRQKDGKIYVGKGHCTLRAHKLAQSEGAPVVGISTIVHSEVKDQFKNKVDHIFHIMTSNEGLPLESIEIAGGYQLLIDHFHWTVGMIAERRNVTAQAIKNTLAVLDLPSPIAEMVDKNEISATLAVETVRKEGASLGTDSLKTAVETAKGQGKTHATKKHLPKAATITRPTKSLDNTDQQKDRTIRTTPEHGTKEIDWNHYGPLLRDTLTTVLRHFKREGIQHIDIVNARQLIKDINNGGEE